MSDPLGTELPPLDHPDAHDGHPLDHIDQFGLEGEEVHGVEKMLEDLHIHDSSSAESAISYLKNHIKEQKSEINTLQ